VLSGVIDRSPDQFDFEIRGNGATGVCARILDKVRASATPLTSPNVAQYLSVRHGTSSGSRVIISSEKKTSGLARRIVSAIRFMSSRPSPSGTSDSRKPFFVSSIAMSLRWTLNV
jgi:hypothetical protein